MNVWKSITSIPHAVSQKNINYSSLTYLPLSPEDWVECLETNRVTSYCSSVCVTDLRSQGLASSPKDGVDVEEMKKVNNDMMRQCEKISKRCKEARRRKWCVQGESPFGLPSQLKFHPMKYCWCFLILRIICIESECKEAPNGMYIIWYGMLSTFSSSSDA